MMFRVKKHKQLLAYLRQGDFSHPGEIEAIQLAMKNIPQNHLRQILDVGSGLGGTADYLQKQGFGSVAGLDIDPILIEYAKKHYPNARFIEGDIQQELVGLSPIRFDLIYCFSSFFCFKNQEQALKQMAKLANPGCQLIVFDYSRQNTKSIKSPFPWSSTASHFNPIFLPELKRQLEKTGWSFKSSLDISAHFDRWYTELLARFLAKRQECIERFDKATFDEMCAGFSHLLQEIQSGRVGGLIAFSEWNYARGLIAGLGNKGNL